MPDTLRKLAKDLRKQREAATAEILVMAADRWEAEREQVQQFIRDMYTGRFAKRAKDYRTLPKWIREAIEADPIYNEETGP